MSMSEHHKPRASALAKQESIGPPAASLKKKQQTSIKAIEALNNSVFANAKERAPKSTRMAKDEKGGKNEVVIEKASMIEWTKEKVEEVMWDVVPETVKELPEPYMSRFAFFCLLGFLATFLAFFARQVESGISDTFISLSKDAGICSSVAKGVTQSVPFVGASTGVWQGDKLFQFKDGSYLLTLTNYNGDKAAYEKMMKYFAGQLNRYTEIGSTQLITYNAIVWTSFYASYDQGGFKQTLRLSGDPNMIFAPLYAYGGVANAYGACPLINYPAFDVSTSVYTFTYDDDLFRSWYPINTTSKDVNGTYIIIYGEPCATFMPTLDYLILPAVDALTWYLQMDSFVTSVAVNLEILPLSALDRLEVGFYQNGKYPFKLQSGRYVNGTFVYGSMTFFTVVDSKYPGSAPSMCFDPNAIENKLAVEWYNMTKAFCTINFMSSFRAGIFALPVFIPQGDSAYNFQGVPKKGWQCPPCGTNDNFYDDIYNTSDKKRRRACNRFYFYYGILTWNSIDSFLDFLIQYDFDFEAINTISFNAQYWGGNAPYNNVYPCMDGTITNGCDVNYWNGDSIAEAFAFCDYNCAYVGMNNNPIDPYNKVLNDYFKKINIGNCGNEIYEEKTFNNLITTAPLTLTETYYECRNSPTDVFLNAVGIANGNVAVLVPLCVAFLMPFIYQYLKLIGFEPPKKEYTKEEKEEAVNELILQLLRARDGKTRQFSKNSVVKSMAKDLMKASKHVPGYADSDDEDSDEDSDDEDSNGNRSRPVSIASKRSSDASNDNRRISVSDGIVWNQRSGSQNALEMHSITPVPTDKSTENPMSKGAMKSSSSSNDFDV